MADGVAVIILILYFTMLGVGPGCNFKGPGLRFTVDGKPHHIKLVPRE